MCSHWPLLVRTGQQCENMRQRPTANLGSQNFKGEEQETGGTLIEFSKPHLRPALQFRLCVQFTSVVNQSEVYPFDQFWYEEWLDGKSRVVLWGKRMLIWSCHLPGHLLSLLSDCLPITPSLSLHTSPPHQSHHHHQDLLKPIWREERAEGLPCAWPLCEVRVTSPSGFLRNSRAHINGLDGPFWRKEIVTTRIISSSYLNL